MARGEEGLRKELAGSDNKGRGPEARLRRYSFSISRLPGAASYLLARLLIINTRNGASAGANTLGLPEMRTGT